MDYIIWGVGNDDQLVKLKAILEEFEVDFEFRDFRDYPPSVDDLLKWGEHEGEEFPLNPRSTFVKKNRKNFDKLTTAKKAEWLARNYQAISRPIIEDGDGEVLSIGGRPERLLKTVFNLDLRDLDI